MSLNVEHIESSQAARIERAEKSKSSQGGGFAALLATLSAELRTFSGISPEMALPIGAAKPTDLNDNPLPRDSGSDTDRGGAIDDGDRMDEPAAGFRPAEARGRARSEQSDTRDDRDAGLADTAGAADGGSRQARAADEGGSDMTAAANTSVAGNARGSDQPTAAGTRTAAVVQAFTGQPGASQAVAEEMATLAAARQAAVPSQSGAYKPTGGADGNAIRAVVTDQGAGVTSQPTASLAASAPVNAQLGRGNKPGPTGPNDGGLLLDDGTIARGDLRPIQGAFKQAAAGTAKAGTPDATATDNAGRPNTNPQAAPAPAPQAAPAMQTQLANAATSPGSMGQTGQPAPGQIADGGMATNTPASQPQTSARARSTGFAGHLRSAAQPAPTAEQVAIQIQRALGTGTDRITIQLRPQELGRVEVKMEVGHDGKLLAVISADKPETLDLLQRDQRSLQDALSNAGLDLDSNSLSFNLNGQDDGEAVAGDGGNGSEHGSEEDDPSDDAALAASGHVNVITEDKIDVLL